MTENLDNTTVAIVNADAAHLHEAIESVTWERRGLLQRLVRAGSLSGTEAEAEARQPGR
jgi:hypothetical protein